MRSPFILAMALWASTAVAQTVTSVQDGDWIDPTTWDCNCVPELDTVEILHTVQFTTNMKLTMQLLHVNAGAVLTMDGPHLVIMLEGIVNDGLMLLAGYVDVDGELFNNGVVHVNGDFFSHGLLAMGGPGTLLTAVNMEMGGTINGEGHICVSGVTVNYGSIEGEVDVCDTSPTTSTPPFLDNNTGQVASTVTFCMGDVCSVSVPEAAVVQELRVWPVPAHEQLTLEGLATEVAWGLEVRDAIGRIIAVGAARAGSRMTVETATLPAGVYSLSLIAPNNTRSVKFVVE
ncbi:MAG: T9SS type A sorting domain-containing protein [Flavobacteriales bacterium]|nr:T9SS type A sorting domain-containing protein [Flavobacteriales bacterium]